MYIQHCNYENKTKRLRITLILFTPFSSLDVKLYITLYGVLQVEWEGQPSVWATREQRVIKKSNKPPTKSAVCACDRIIVTNLVAAFGPVAAAYLVSPRVQNLTGDLRECASVPRNGVNSSRAQNTPPSTWCPQSSACGLRAGRRCRATNEWGPATGRFRARVRSFSSRTPRLVPAGIVW